MWATCDMSSVHVEQKLRKERVLISSMEVVKITKFSTT